MTSSECDVARVMTQCIARRGRSVGAVAEAAEQPRAEPRAEAVQIIALGGSAVAKSKSVAARPPMSGRCRGLLAAANRIDGFCLLKLLGTVTLFSFIRL